MAKIYYYECVNCDHEWENEDPDEEGRAEECPSCYEENIWPYDSDIVDATYKKAKKQFNKNQKQFEMKEVNVTLAEGQKILEIRQGQAAEIRELRNNGHDNEETVDVDFEEEDANEDWETLETPSVADIKVKPKVKARKQ